MIFTIILAACSVDADCLNNGACNTKKNICVCIEPFTGDTCAECLEQYTGGDCSTCVDGFTRTIEYLNGKNASRCVNDVCLDEQNDSCFNHGECYKNSKDKWGCRCFNKYTDSSKCKSCKNKYYELQYLDTTKCISGECLDPAHEVECSNNGTCF